jgi:hypothetical protein
MVRSKRGLEVIREEVLGLLVIELSRFVNILPVIGNLGYEISRFPEGF